MFASLNPGQIGLHAISLPEGLALAERHGFGGYDPSLGQLHEEVTRHGAAVVRGWFVRHGLQTGAWVLPFEPWSVAESVWQEWLAKLPAMAASAAAAGAHRAAIWTHPGSNERDYAASFAHYVARFQPVARVLAAHGFDGPVTAEPFDDTVNALGAEGAAARTARATRSAAARAVSVP